ncbi:MAG: hypothetical protein V7782_09995 [Psychromonas sp.]
MHLCFSITAHGFGHGAISCSVINSLMNNHPDIKITVFSLLDKSYLTSRLKGEFDLIKVANDFGMMMDSAIKVDVENSAIKYQHLFNDWPARVEQEKAILEKLRPDCVISNISPVTLAAAQQLNIRTASVAPFNWAQIFKAYCLPASSVKIENAADIYSLMADIYNRVNYIYKPLPSVPLAQNDEIKIASICNQMPSQNNKLLNLLPETTKKIGLIALGGLPMPLDLKNWPRLSGWHWIVDQTQDHLRDDMTQATDITLPFLELVANSDLILTKPGYGTYCEIAAVARYKKVRVLSLVRPDWPETPFLNNFLGARVPFSEVQLEQLKSEHLADLIIKLNKQPYPEATVCKDGAAQLVEHLLSKL